MGLLDAFMRFSAELSMANSAEQAHTPVNIGQAAFHGRRAHQSTVSDAGRRKLEDEYAQGKVDARGPATLN